MISVAAANTPAQLIQSAQPDWPQFRGPRRDGISDARNLLKSWPEGGPKLLWSAPQIGNGFSSPVIAKDRLFITGDTGDNLCISAFDLKARPLWRATNGAAWKGDYPGARASVAYNDGRIYHENAHGRVACFDAKNGHEIWSVDLIGTFRGKNIYWALSECLLVDERAVFATAGGPEALLVALDKKNGTVIWKSEPLLDSEGERAPETASYVSPVLVQFGKRRLIIGCSLKHLFCVDADSGKLQWAERMPTTYSVLAMMPVLVGDSIFMTAPHGRGGRLFRLVAPGDAQGKVGVEELWTTRLDTCQGGVVHVDGKLFGSFYGPRKGWAAVNAKDGEILYQAEELIKGAGLYANERLYVLSEDGWMVLLAPGEKAFEEKGRFRLAEARKNDAWAHPVIHDGRLYLRYHDTMSCYDIRGTGK